MELIIMGIFMIISFYFGFKLGQPKKEEPKKVVKIRKKQQKEEPVSDPVQIMLQNIDNYNGTAFGQQDVPDDIEEW